eukprot:TRINITY_DN2996_c0_g1_i3.p1 TRINITY_DN2996_c0_g1~~TRINITY_DN2996_c0_g1_i3.p1  ORF type:complete len:1456 (+),score=625.75 TRINITY_DN2996_c0_g1_i3:616-4368(+)
MYDHESSLGSLGVKDQFLGYLSLPVTEIQELMEAQQEGTDGKKQPIEQWFPLQTISQGDKVTGDILLRIFYEETAVRSSKNIGDGGSVVSASTFQSSAFGGGSMGDGMDVEDLQEHLNELEEQIQMYQEDRTKIVAEITSLFNNEYKKFVRPPKKIGMLFVTGVQGRDLVNLDGLLGKSDPYLKISFQDQELKSTVIDNNLNPNWEKENFNFNVWSRPIDVMIEIFDEDPMGADASMGFVSVPVQAHLSGAEPGDEVQKWYEIQDKDGSGKAKGELKVTLQFVQLDDEDDDDEDVALVASEESSEELSGDDWGRAMQMATLVKENMLKEVLAQKKTADSMAASRQVIIKQLEDIFGVAYNQYCKPLGEMHILVAEARGLVGEKVLGVAKQLDAYAVVEFQGDKITTGVVRSQHPKWDKNSVLAVIRDPDVINIQVFNKKALEVDNLIGSAVVNLGDFVLEKGVERTEWFPIKIDGEQKGEVRLELTYKEKMPDKALLEAKAKKESVEEIIEKARDVKDALLEAAVVQKEQYMMAKEEKDAMVRQLYDLFATDYEVYCRPKGELQISVVEGRSLKPMDVKLGSSGKADPYVVVSFQDQEVKTATVKKSLDPKWNAEFSLSLIRDLDEIIFSVYDFNTLGKPDPMGQLIIDFTSLELQHDVRISEWFELQPMEGMKDPEGSILVELCFIDSTKESADEETTKSSSSSSSSSSDSEEEQEEEEEEEQDQEAMRNEGIKRAEAVKEVLKDQLEVRKAQYLRAKNDRDEILRQLRDLFSEPFRKYCRPLGVLKVTVLEGKDLEKKDLSGSSDPFCVLEFQEQEKQTAVKEKNLNPNWGETFKFSVFEVPQTFKMTVYDYDKPKIGQKEGTRDFMGRMRINLMDEFETLADGEWYEKWFPLINEKGNKQVKGEILLQFQHVLPQFEEEEEEAPILDALVEANSVRESLERTIMNQRRLVHDARKLAQESHRLYASEFNHWVNTRKADHPTLTVEICGARDLAAADIMEGTSDPYCVVTVSGEDHEHKTNVVEKTLDPEWGETFKFKIRNPTTAELTIKVYDHDDAVLGIGGGSDYLGEVSIATFALQEDKELDAWLPLKSPKKRFALYKIKGEIHVRVLYSWKIEAEDEIPEEDTDEEARFAKETMKKAKIVKGILMAHLKDLKIRVEEQEQQLEDYEKQFKRMGDAVKRADLLERRLKRSEKEQAKELDDMRDRYEAQLAQMRQMMNKKDEELEKLRSRGVLAAFRRNTSSSNEK